MGLASSEQPKVSTRNFVLTGCPSGLAAQGVAPGPVASASPGSFLEVQTLRPHHTSTESESAFSSKL